MSAASWVTRPMLSFDLETTGPDPETARIVTGCCAHINGTQVGSSIWLVNPGVPIPAEATAVHGVTDDIAAAGLDPAVAVAQIVDALRASWQRDEPVVIFNASYDLTVLDRELDRHCGQRLGDVGGVIDPFVIDKHLDKYRKGSRTLTATCASYGVRQDGAHSADGDALAAARLAWVMGRKYPQIAAVTLAELNMMQQRWRTEWAANFEQYLIKQGKPETVDGAWPVRG